MAKSTAHPDRHLISSDDVQGTEVYGTGEENVGEIDHLMIEKVSGRVTYAVMSFGGFMGLGHSHYPIPWSALKYDTALGGYRTGILAISAAILLAAILLAAFNFAALADEVIGAIVSIDVEGGTVTLDSGQTFILTETIDPTALQIGQDVSVTYELTTDGLSAATMIAPVI